MEVLVEFGVMKHERKGNLYIAELTMTSMPICFNGKVKEHSAHAPGSQHETRKTQSSQL